MTISSENGRPEVTYDSDNMASCAGEPHNTLAGRTGRTKDGFPAFTSIAAFVIASGESSPARMPITVAGFTPAGAPSCKGARS